MDKRGRYTQTIWAITEALRNADSIEGALSSALRHVANTVHAQAGTIWLYDKGGDDRVHPVFVFGGTDIRPYSLALGEGMAGHVIKNGLSVMVEDCREDPRWVSRFDELTQFETRSILCVPLRSPYETIGCIQLINKSDGMPFDSADLSLCENLALLVAIAVEEKGLLIRFDPSRKSLLSLRKAVKEYRVGNLNTSVLKGIDLDVYENELLVVLGESGCGKTTLLNLLGGMDTLTGGSYRFEGEEMVGADDRVLTGFRRNSVGFVFQTYNLMPTLTARENLALIAEICNHPMDVDEALDKVGLLGEKDVYPAQLSGGQQQLVSIARAMVKQPRIILADEPTAALDAQTSVEVLSVLESIVRLGGCTLVLITHNSEIARMANRVVRIKDGVIADIFINMHPVPAAELAW